MNYLLFTKINKTYNKPYTIKTNYTIFFYKYFLYCYAIIVF